MSQPTVTAIADDRVRHTAKSRNHCPTCTAYIGRMGHGPNGCTGSAIAHVAATHPASVVQHDHEE